MVPIPTATGTPGAPIPGPGEFDFWIAMTPDQAPIPSFLVTSAPPGSATTFDASTSTVQFGSITSYQWNFGDGSPGVTTSEPTTTHVFDAPGTYTVTLTVTDSAGKSATASKSVVISTGPAAAVTLSASALSFGQVPLGSSSAPSTITVTNTGGAPLALGAVTLAGLDGGDFRLASDGCSGQTIPAGGSCTFTAAFVPTLLGSRSALVSIPDNASGSPQTVTLSGTGIGAGFSPSAGTIAFGPVIVGRPSQPQSLIVTNSGNVPLTISSVALAGANSADFAIAGDTCRGQTVQPGGTCATDVTLTPTAAGPRTAELVYSDDASGSPQTVSLTGTGSLTGITGRVVDGTNPQQRGVGAIVYAWPQVGGTIDVSRYLDTYTDSSGDYSFAGLSPGKWAIEVDPTNSLSLIGASAVVQVQGSVVTENFALQAPRALAGGLTVDTPSGPARSGVPTVNWDEPFTIQVPLNVALRGKPNDTVMTAVEDQFGTTDGGFQVGAFAMLFVHYDATGTPDYIQGYQGQQVPASDPLATAAEADTARATPVASAAQGSGSGSGSGFFTGPTNGFEAGDIVTVPGSGGYQVGPSGPITPGFTSYYNKDTHAAAIKLCGIGIRFAPVKPKQYQPPLNGDPYGTLSTGVNNAFNNAVSGAFNGPGQSFGNVVGTAHGDLSSLANLSVDLAFPGLNKAVHGDTENLEKFVEVGFEQAKNVTGFEPGKLIEDLTQPKKCEDDDSNVYVDPSGTVHTRAGRPIFDAQVTLLRAPQQGATFTTVPNGSAIMSLANRRNPDFTDAFGDFGWDVLPGLYQVTASHAGCLTGGTSVVTVPPAALGLSISLVCAHLHYAASSVSLRIAHISSRGRTNFILLSAHVSGRGRATRLGTVTFRAGRRQLMQAVIDPETDTATAIATVRGHQRLTAQYSGDGTYAPSRSRAVATP